MKQLIVIPNLFVVQMQYSYNNFSHFLFNSRSGSCRAPPPGPRRPPTAHVGIVVLWRQWVRVRSERRLPTMLLTQTWWPWRPPPLSKIMSKHDEDMGYIGKKNISVQLWLVRVDSTQRMIKKHVYSLKKHTFCQHARWSAARGTSSYKIKNELLSSL